MADLTDKQKAFIQEYLIDLNATHAAIRAGYSEDSAKQIGYENLTKPYLQEAIATAMSEREKRTLITQDQVIEQIKEDREQAKKLKQLGPAMKGNELLAKHLKMLTDKVENTIKDDIKITFADKGLKDV